MNATQITLRPTRMTLRKINPGHYEYDYPRSVGLRDGERLTWTVFSNEDGTWTDHLELQDADGELLAATETAGSHDRYTRLADIRATQESMTVAVRDGLDKRYIVQWDEHGNRF